MLPLLDPRISAKLSALQSLEDAIAYRQARLQAPCQACTAGSRCPDHHQDEHLIATYQDRQATALRDALAGTDPDDIAIIMQPGDDLPPTVTASSAALLAQLRQLAADGPVVLDLDDGPVVIELDGPVIIEHPLTPGSNAT